MAAPTYSLSVTGYKPRNPFAVKNIKVPDASLNNINTGFVGGQAYAMQTGDLILCQMPDGGTRLMKIDAERSTPGNLILLPV